MELVLVRHAVAEDAEGAGRAADARRRLTREGRRRMRLGAAGLRALVPALDAVASSPLVRAVETARLVAAPFGVEPTLLPALAPGARPAALLPWLRGRGGEGAIALVGHEPHLSRLAALLLAGRGRPSFTFRKGGACLLELPAGVRPGSARLRWLLTPRALRLLGGSGADRS